MWNEHGRCLLSLYFIRLLVVMIVLVKVCDACSRRRNPPPKRPPTTQPPTQKKTTSIVGTKSSNTTVDQISPSKVSTTLASPSISCQFGKYDICYTTNIQNLTNVTIGRRLQDLRSSRAIGVLFDDERGERHLFLKWLQANKTECSNIQGYMIIIKRDCDDHYSYTVKRLNQTSATRHCEQAQNCTESGYLLETLTAATTSKPSEQLSSTKSSSTHTNENKPTNTKGTADSPTKKPSTASGSEDDGVSTTTIVAEKPTAGRSDGGEDSTTTTIVIPVITVVVLLVIVLVIIALWYKRRSARKCYEEKMQNSVERAAGPINGDVYTVVNPSTEKTKDEKGENNDMVYIELSHQKTEKSADKDCEVRSSQQGDYADISHILTPGESTYENATPKCDQDYANVVLLQ